MAAAESKFKQAWSYELLCDFYEYAATREVCDIKRYTLSFDRYVRLFVAMDRKLKIASEISFPRLCNALNGVQFWRSDLFVSFLIDRGFMKRVSDDEWRSQINRERVRRRLSRIDGMWYVALICRFHDHLRDLQRRNATKGYVNERLRPAEKTVDTNIAAAIQFVASIEEHRQARQLSQSDVDHFLLISPGYRSALSPFMRYLNERERLFKKLKIDRLGYETVGKNYIGYRRSQKLLKDWHASKDGATRNALIGILALLYAQPVARILEIRLVDLSQGVGSQYRIAFKTHELSLDKRTSTILGRYLEMRHKFAGREKAWENPYLFPGRIAGNHLHCTSVACFLKPLGVTSSQLYASALINAYLNGMKYPKVAATAFGLAMPTAMNYARVIDERVSVEFKRQMERSG